MLRTIAATFVSALLAGCSLLAPLPEPSRTAERLRAFPLRNLPLHQPVTVYWNENLVPFIDARDDGDAAFTLGMVHAHLRLAQMDLYRKAAAGRLAEMLGPFLTDVDHALRILGPARAAQQMELVLSPADRKWIERYVEGINFLQDHAPRLPHELRLLGVQREPWTVADVLAVSRIFGADVNWLSWFSLLPLWGTNDWPYVWDRIVRNGKMSLPSFGALPPGLPSILADMSRSGSNSVAVSSGKTSTGSALMANDPHLGIQIPNLWVIAGYRCPSYHVVGLMLPGVPAVALGRNEHFAWGGTNMRAASSDLYDVSHLPASDFTERRESIKVRWWPDREVVVRTTPFGPVVTDAPLLKDYHGPPLALKWIGYDATDEIGALLAVNRARDWNEFKAAWNGYGVSAQNILYADVKGNIGQLLAVTLPGRQFNELPGLFLDPANPRHIWKGRVKGSDLPSAFNPEQGYLASTNNIPVATSPPVGFFYSENDRIRRIREKLEHAENVDVDFMGGIQTDVTSPVARDLRDLMVGSCLDTYPRPLLLSVLSDWDGSLDAESRSALAFELVLYHLAEDYYGAHVSERATQVLVRSAGLVEMLHDDLRAESGGVCASFVLRAIREAAGEFDRWGNWGAMHRLDLRHVLLGRIPLLGAKYRYGNFPVSGGSTTLMKTAHAPTNEKHNATYGSQARHISDLSDPDANWFVLLGGQDGWLNSSRLTDQVELWRLRKYLHVPLKVETVGKLFPYRSELLPGSESPQKKNGV